MLLKMLLPQSKRSPSHYYHVKENMMMSKHFDYYDPNNKFSHILCFPTRKHSDYVTWM